MTHRSRSGKGSSPLPGGERSREARVRGFHGIRVKSPSPQPSPPRGEGEQRSVRQAYNETASIFRAAGVATPELDARLLLCHAAGLTHEALIAHGDQPLGAGAAARLEACIARRLDGEPVSRIRGVREFYGRDFLIDAQTLDPRPDTETLIDAALDLVAKNGWRERPLRLLDLGTGSGCILLTLLAELPHAEGIGTDMSVGALRLARENALRLGVEARARFVAADWFAGLTGPFDLIVSNPPYIESAAIAALSREVAGHDPLAALDGGPDGLDAYRRIAGNAAGALRPGGRLLVEIGATQAQAVSGLFRAAGLEVGADAVWADLAGRPRCVAAERPLEAGKGPRVPVKISLESRDVRARFEPTELRRTASAGFGAAGCMATRANFVDLD